MHPLAAWVTRRGRRGAGAPRAHAPLRLPGFMALVAALLLVVIGYGLACLWFRVIDMPPRPVRDGVPRLSDDA